MKYKKWFLFFIFGILGCLVLLYVSLPWFSRYLVYENPVDKADLIVVLSGAGGCRVAKGVELYQKGVAGKILMAGGGRFFDGFYADYMKDYAIRLGVKPEDILVERKALSTYENAVFTYPIIEKLGAKKVILVTSAFHSKRAYRVFRKVMKNSNIQFYSMTSDDKISHNLWWKDYEMSQVVLIEWAKTILYWFKV